MKYIITFFTTVVLLSQSAVAASSDMDAAIHDLQKQWAVANYDTPEDKQDDRFTVLEKKAEEVVKTYPGKAEPLAWNAIIVSTHAGVRGGLGALNMVEQARDLLIAAEKINPKALHGSIYTSLGSLYYQVPGWPLGFGDDDEAEKYLKKALELNPDGIDPNYFYGDYLFEDGKYKEAIAYLNKAMTAPPRPQRPLADKGRQEDIKKLLKKIQFELSLQEEENE